MRLLAVLFVVLFVGDAVVTFCGINFAGCVEQNPFMAPIADSWRFPALKLAMAPLLAGVVLAVGRRVRPVAMAGFGMMSTFLAVVLVMNLMVLVGLR